MTCAASASSAHVLHTYWQGMHRDPNFVPLPCKVSLEIKPQLPNSLKSTFWKNRFHAPLVWVQQLELTDIYSDNLNKGQHIRLLILTDKHYFVY